MPLLPWASRRRAELLQLLDQLEASIVELDRAVAEQALVRPAARRLMTHPGVGPVTALAFTLTIGPAERFRRGKQIASYLGLIPSEYSSGGQAQRKCRALAKVAMARKLAVRLYWMLRLQVNYAQLIQGSHAGQPGTFRGRG